MLLALVLSIALQGAPATAADAPVIREIAHGVYLAPDADVADNGPDGASVIFEAPQGLVVVDTGRHETHSDAIMAFADARDRPIVALVNTHWHLDHSSGNYRIKARFPEARLFASNAAERALTTGFLAQNYTLGRTRWETERNTLEPDRRARLRSFLDVMENLRPDTVIDRSQRTRLGGRSFEMRLARNAVTDGDLWLYDRRTRIAVVGDLITLPAPYLDTACPEGWRAALAEIWATPFHVAVPGHGAPMTRADVAIYRQAFDAYLACVHGTLPPEQCGAVWADAAAPLLWEGARAAEYAAEYVPYLRENGGKAPDCQADA